MRQYQFREINQPSTQVDGKASDEMAINGRVLSNIIPGYQQLSVSGRGLVAPIINTNSDIPLRDGVLVNYQNYPSREIVVTYGIKAKTSRELRASFEVLNRLLFLDNTAKERLDITFLDDLDDDGKPWHYYGLLESVDTIEETSLQIISTFTLLCPDPWKYSEQKQGKRVKLRNYPTVPDELIITIPDDTAPSEIHIQNTNSYGTHSFYLYGSFPSNLSKQVRVVWEDDQVRVYHGQKDVTSAIGNHSFPENFIVRDNEEINVSFVPTSKTESPLIKWRDKSL